MLTEPAVGNTFFGRADILSVLNKRTSALKSGYRQNVALTGQMLSGKSSILYQFLYSLRDTSILPVYIEVTNESFGSFAQRFIATLLYNYFTSSGKTVRKDTEALLELASTEVPQTAHSVKKVLSDISKRSFTEAYKRLFNLTSVIKKETGKSCVVILDEFHNLESFGVKKPYMQFGQIIMVQKDTMYVVSSSQKRVIKRILSEKLSLLYGNFEMVEVSGFDDKTSRAFIDEKLRHVTLPEDYANYLIDFTEGNPFYLDVVSGKLLELANAERISVIDEGIMIKTFSSLLYNTNGTISQYFTNTIMSLLEKGLREDCLDVLVLIAMGRNKLKDIANFSGKKDTATLSRKLGKLMELDLIAKNGIFYQIEDKMFAFWLRTVYHAKKTTLIDDIVNKTSDFESEIKKDLSLFLCEIEKSAGQRLKELFSAFNGELIEIEKKTRRLPRFIKIETREYSSGTNMTSYQSQTQYWVCHIAKSRVDEPAVSRLIEDSGKDKKNIKKRLCIALEGIENNALLLAKAKNIWVWDLAGINNIMRLYKHRTLVKA